MEAHQRQLQRWRRQGTRQTVAWWVDGQQSLQPRGTQRPCAPAPMASETAPVAATIAQPVATEKSPAASGRSGLLTRSISISYSCSMGHLGEDSCGERQLWWSRGGAPSGVARLLPVPKQTVSVLTAEAAARSAQRNLPG